MNTQKRSHRLTSLSPASPAARALILICAALLCFGALGCDESRIVTTNNSDNAAESQNNAPSSPDDSDEDTPNPDGDSEFDDDDEYDDEYAEEVWVDEEHDGPEAPGQDPGDLSGNWRVATVDGDKPGVSFYIDHVAGAQTGQGTYTMGFALFPHYDGASGELMSVNYQDDTLTVVWNPTDDSQEMLTLSATKQPDGNFEGTVTARRNPNIDAEVRMSPLNP